MVNHIQDTGASLGGQADVLKEQALELAAVAKERLSESGEAVKRFTIQQPAKALGIALGMGVLLGWLIKRR